MLRKILWAGYSSAMLLLCSVVIAQQPAKPITVFVARKIITMDPGWPEATAVAVRDGKILWIGTLEELKPWLNTSPYKIDRTFENKVLLPGFIEAHGRLYQGATALMRPLLAYLPEPNPYGPAFPGVKTREEAAAKLQEYVAQAKSWGYDVIAMGGQHLDKTQNL
jgi:predicted amidohydrolase YtcJ